VLIDWFTVGAQVLNFLVLVWLMKRVLYKPILGAIDARDAGVARELADATAKEAAADQAGAEFKRQQAEFESARAALLERAAAEAAAERVRLLEEASAAAGQLKQRSSDMQQLEHQQFAQALGRRAQGEVLLLARRVLKDLAGADVERQMVMAFCEKLHMLQEADRRSLALGLEPSPEPLRIQSAFALAPELKQTLHAAIQTALGKTVGLRFDIAPEILCGIELSVPGYRLSWSIEDYLADLERRLAADSTIIGSPRPEVRREAQVMGPVTAVLAAT
jgi:F-type H+-transporting ATPase subunit b